MGGTWFRPDRARKFHFFDDLTSVCGRHFVISVYGGEEAREAVLPSEYRCKLCTAKLGKRDGTIVAVGHEPEEVEG